VSLRAGTAPVGARGLQGLREDLAGRDLDLLRAWPRGPEHLLLHVRPTGADREPGWVAAQWFADDARAAHVARSSARSSRSGADSGATSGASGRVRHLTGTGVVLQPGGADRRLVGLPPLLLEPDTELVAHRPERRAVVRHRSRQVFTKVVPPERLDGLLTSAGWRPDGVDVPSVLAVDRVAGTVTTAALPGSTLHELDHPDAVAIGPFDRSRALVAWRAAGAAVAALHAGAPPSQARSHGVADEVEVTRAWLERADRHGALAPDRVAGWWSQALAAHRRLDAGRAAPAATLHRDLHDKQVVVDGATGSAAVLDLDLVAIGEPALDLANLLVHLVLRDEQAALVSGVSPQRAPSRARAFLSGYGELPDPDRVRDLALLSAVRVAAVYAFREPLSGPGHVGGPVPGRPGQPGQPGRPGRPGAHGRSASLSDGGGHELGERLVPAVAAGLAGVC